MPKDKEAETALDYDQANNEQLIQLFLSDTELNFLFIKGIFNIINEAGNTMIDNYEDDNIILLKVLEKLKWKRKQSTGRLRRLLFAIEQLFEEAIDRDTGVYFYF